MPTGAIIAFKPNDLRIGKILVELQDVVYVRAAPAVDRLIVVADTAKVAVGLSEKAQPEILDNVRILVFVD